MNSENKTIDSDGKTPEASGRSQPKPPVRPDSFGLADIQYTAGNLAVQRMLQTGSGQRRLAISQPGDSDEVEADRIADQVVAAPTGIIQPKCAVGAASATTCEQYGQAEKHQRKERPGTITHSASETSSRIGANAPAEQGGQPLSSSVRAFFESRFDRDLSAVRVHVSNQAAESARTIQARAFTVGQDVVFGAGEYAPETSDGKRLLAHELTHTIQQTAGQASRAPSLDAASAAHPHEQGAQPRAADASLTSVPVVPASGHALAVQRQPAPPPAPTAAAIKLEEDYQDALGHDLWERATIVLNGFSDDDIKKRVPLLNPLQRLAMRQAVPQWNSRVRGALLDFEYREALKRTDWVQAAIHLNGFNDEGIDERVAELPPGQATNLAAGAMAGTEGISQQRIVGAVDRLQRKLDAKGGGGRALGTTVISEVMRLQQQGAAIGIARAAAFQQLKLAVSVGADSVKPAIADRVTAVRAIAAAMAGAAIAEPGMLSEGKLAHAEISLYYASLNPYTLVDPSLITVIQALRLTKAAYNALYAKLPEELLQSLKLRPDIVDLRRMQVYEIKSVESGPRAVPEMLDYIDLLESFEIPGVSARAFTFHPGSPTNPGTSGFLPSPKGGWIIFTCPAPGAIIYRIILPVENPRNALERLKSELKGVSNMMVGVEGVTAISLALAVGFEQLLPLLIDAALVAGQAIPELPKLVQGAGQLAPVH